MSAHARRLPDLVTENERHAWEKNGFFLLRDFASSDLTQRILERAIEVARTGNWALACGDRSHEERRLSTRRPRLTS